MCKFDQVQKHKEACEHYAKNAGFRINPWELITRFRSLWMIASLFISQVYWINEKAEKFFGVTVWLTAPRIQLAPARVTNR